MTAQLSPSSVRPHILFFLLHWTPRGKEVLYTCFFYKSMDTRRDVFLIRLYPLSWRGWSQPKSKLHKLRQPDDIPDPSMRWTCKHTELSFSVLSYRYTTRYRSNYRLEMSDLWTNPLFELVLLNDSVELICKAFIRHSTVR